MAHHPNTDGSDHNQPVLTVGEISHALKRCVEGAFDFVRVRGELSGFKRAGSGHLYFSLKDENAVLDGVCWRNAASRLAIGPEDGMEVVVTGRLTTYPGRSKYQIVVEAMELAGEGALLKLLEDRRKKLAAEGLFDSERKKPIPFLPEVIGVVTSPTGAVIRDILHRLSDRFPRRVLLWPVLVQGQGAAEQVAAAIAGFNRLPAAGAVPRPDVLIVARGGGSLEDLWAFNEEVVVRAAADSGIPLISAVGHETDTTLIDFAADRRAPTPTAAAEMAVPVRMDLVAQVLDCGTRLVGAVNRMTKERRIRLEAISRGIPKVARLVEEARQRLDDWSERLVNSLAVGLDRRRALAQQLAGRLVSPGQRIAFERNRVLAEARALDSAVKVRLQERRRGLDHLAALLDSFSYQRVLERGFALVHDRAGHAVVTVEALKPGMGLGLRFHDGEAAVTVDDGAKPRKRSASKAGKPDDGQGTLL
jgi:exodeoxyribonuclease VII large subunit